MSKTVELITKKGSVRRSFESAHAFNILTKVDNTSWELPKDSPLELTKDGFRTKQSEGANKSEEANGSNKPRRKAPKSSKTS